MASSPSSRADLSGTGRPAARNIEVRDPKTLPELANALACALYSEGATPHWACPMSRDACTRLLNPCASVKSADQFLTRKEH